MMNTERSYWNDKGYEGIKGLEVHHLTKAEFDHGATCNRGRATAARTSWSS